MSEQDIKMNEKELFISSLILKSISNPTRLWLLMLLSVNEFNVKQLENKTGIRQPTICRYLKSLNRIGLVRRRRLGSNSFYSLANPKVVSIIRSLKGMATDRLEKVG